MIDSIFQRYEIPSDYPREPLGTLYFILRKAELAKDLTHSEWEWLASHDLVAAISIITSQEENRLILSEYRTTLNNEIKKDLVELRRNKFVQSSILTIPSVESERALVFFKVHNQEELSNSELIHVDDSYKAFLSFSKIKQKYGITEDIQQDGNAIRRLSKIELLQSLAANDFQWLHDHMVLSALPLITYQTTGLLKQYQGDATSLSPEEQLKLFLLLQQIAEDIVLSDKDQKFLQSHGFEFAFKLAQTAEFASLKQQYLASSFDSNDPSEHLYKVLKNIQTEKPLTEPDVNYLKKRRLNKTIKFSYQENADQLVDKINSGQGLTEEDIEWCIKFDFPEIPFLALKYEYQVADRKDNPGEQLHCLLLKLKAEQRLTDDDVVWLEAEELLRPHTKLFTAHHRLLALHYEQEFKRTKGFWNIVNASADWRKADQPQTAIKLTNNLQNIRALKEAKLRSALFTTRGGALRDIDKLKEAENCAREAIDHFSQSHNPYTLMGALCYDTRRYQEGDEWFEKAVKRGAQPNDQESEIRRILNRKKGKERQDIIDHLLKKDPIRFAWVKQYAKNSNKRM
jgi:hypothetical protein